jgi:transposase
MMIDGAIDTAVMKVYVDHMLIPALHDGDIVIWDNVPMHTNAEVIASIEAAGARVVALPPYSPDLNPIEECISKIKAALRSAKARTTQTLQRALRHALDAITVTDIQGWFRHAGYRIT